MKETVIPVVREQTRRVKIVFELKKDLQEDEVICEHCHGTGLEIADNVYGIRGDTTHIGVRFPYKHQSLTFCKHCFNGVLKKCPSCGSLLVKHMGCACGYDKKMRKALFDQESKERWEKAEKMSLSKAWEICDCLYVEDVDQCVFSEGELEDVLEDFGFSEEELDDFIESERERLKNPRIYLTEKRGILLDAERIAELGCEDLHEEAYKRCDIECLQKLLDEWCKKQTGAITYFPDYRKAVAMESYVKENKQ
jgi:hypothetical protein